MSNFVVVSRDTLAGKHWRRATSYTFAATTSVVPVLASELSTAASVFPLGFLAQGASFELAIVMGIEMGRNLFVTSDGRWLASYVPAMLRGYPFQVANGQNGQKILCVDAEMLVDASQNSGEAFFKPDGSLSEVVQSVVDMLHSELGDLSTMSAACAVLQEHQLIVPWDIEIQSDVGVRKLEGLFRIDEKAMNALPDDQFLTLRKNGAMPLAYCHLMSMQHLSLLGRLVQARAQEIEKKNSIQQATLSGDIDLSILTRG